MTSYKKPIIITALVTALLLGGSAIIKASNTANAAGKLDADIIDVSLESLKKNLFGIPTSVIYRVKFKINNPTNNDVEITQPYVIVSIQDSTGAYKKVTNTAIPSSELLNIKAKSSTPLIHDVELRATNVLPIIPQFASYLVSRIRGEKSTEKMKIDFTCEAMGLTVSTSKIIAL